MTLKKMIASFWRGFIASVAMSVFCFWEGTLVGCLCAGFSVGASVAGLIFLYHREETQ